MIFGIKKLLYRILSQEGYLRMMHRGFYFLYRLGVLKKNPGFKYHYMIQKLIEPNFVVVDIGANLGYFCKNFAKLANKGKVIAIEPVPVFHKTLKHFLGNYKNVTIHNCALGTENGTIIMVLPETDGMMRTGLPHVATSEEEKKTNKTAEVNIRKGSELLSELEKIDYIKCDIEGYEWTVFQEIKPLIEKHQPFIQIEIADINLDDMLTFFRELNYKQFGIKDFNFIEDNGKQAEQGDYFFVPENRLEKFSEQFINS